MAHISENRLENKTVLVTGGSRGIGAGIAQLLAKNGAKIALTYSTNEDSAKQIISELPGEGHFCLPMNVGIEDSVKQGVDMVMERFGAISALVNNAGVTKDQLLLRMSSQDFEEVIRVNLFGTFYCTKAVMKHMLKARSGSIVHITSVVGQKGNAGQANYAASKGAIEAFSKSVALELSSRQIRSNCVAPGFIETDMTGAMTETQKTAIFQAVPLGRVGQVEDVAACVLFLISDESRYLTGQTLSVNGGLLMP